MKKNNLFVWLSIISIINLPVSINAQVTDVDGNIYKIVQIGNQVWMGGNLNVGKFRNGDPIPQAKTLAEWENAGNTSSPAWCYYDNDPVNGLTLGKLFNWYAVTDERGLAPLGWHIPSDEEWTELTDNQGGKLKAGIIMKSMIMWNDYENKREKGVFEGLPGGIRLNGKFKNGGESGKVAYWWSYTSGYLSLKYYSESAIRSGWSKQTGISVRCIKDFTGEWKEYYENGQLKRIGTTSNGIYTGEWKEYYENGQLSGIGNYDGFKIGEWKHYNKKGKLYATGKYNNLGETTGEWKIYQENGRIGSIGNLENGKREGEWKEYHESGQLSAIGNYERWKTGEWKYYHENGQLSSIGNFKVQVNSKGIVEAWKIGEWKSYHENGQLWTIWAYQDDKLMEIISLFDKNGNKLDQGTLVNGNGTVNRYDEEGNHIKTVDYLNGQVQE